METTKCLLWIVMAPGRQRNFMLSQLISSCHVQSGQDFVLVVVCEHVCVCVKMHVWVHIWSSFLTLEGQSLPERIVMVSHQTFN